MHCARELAECCGDLDAAAEGFDVGLEGCQPGVVDVASLTEMVGWVMGMRATCSATAASSTGRLVRTSLHGVVFFVVFISFLLIC